MKFIHVSDLHLVPPGEKLWGFDPLARLDACLADIAAIPRRCGFLRDQRRSGRRGEIAAYQGTQGEARALPARDASDARQSRRSRELLLRLPRCPRDPNGFVQSAISREGLAFFFLDTLKGPPSSAGLYCDKRKAWLARRARQAGGTPPVVSSCTIRPSTSRHRLDGPDQARGCRRTFARLLDGHNIRHIFFGHAHRPISGQWRGIPFSAPPSLVHQLPLVAGPSRRSIATSRPCMRSSTVESGADGRPYAMRSSIGAPPTWSPMPNGATGSSARQARRQQQSRRVRRVLARSLGVFRRRAPRAASSPRR